MSDLKTELQTKVLPVILNGTTGQPLSEHEIAAWDNEERSRTGEPLAPVTNTDKLYNCVKANPGKSGRWYTEALPEINKSSVSSLLTQLRNGGWLQSIGKRGDMVYVVTSKPRVVNAALPPHTLEALAKGRAVREENLRQRREAKAAKKAAKEVAKQEAKKPEKNHAQKVLEVTRTQLNERIGDGVLHESFARTLRTVSATQLIDAIGVRTAKGLYEELKAIFG